MGTELPGEIPVVSTNGVTPENPTGATVSGFGNVLTQAWIVHDLDQRWAVALGGQLIAPTSTNGVASDAWEQVTGLVVRAMLPEISSGSYFAPQARYGIDFEGNDDGRMLRQLRIAPTFNINLPHNLFFTLYPSPDIRLNYGTPVWGQTGRLFVPLQLHGRLEAHRAYRNLGRVRHSDHQGFSRLHFQNSIESGLFILIAVPSRGRFKVKKRIDARACDDPRRKLPLFKDTVLQWVICGRALGKRFCLAVKRLAALARTGSAGPDEVRRPSARVVVIVLVPALAQEMSHESAAEAAAPQTREALMQHNVAERSAKNPDGRLSCAMSRREQAGSGDSRPCSPSRMTC